MDGFVGIHRNTTLDLNGPVISITTQPEAVSTCGVATFTGIATATFPTQTPSNPAKLTGSLSYRWHYKVGSATTSGQMSNGAMVGLGLTGITGAASTNLTVYGTSTTEPYTLEGIKFFLRPDYDPSAYGTADPITVATGRSTGNANNEPFDSDTVAYTFYPSISVTTQPAGVTKAQDISADFNVGATVSDDSQDSSLTYQWVLNGSDLSDSATVIGSATSALSLSLSDVGVSTITAKVTHPTACNSPIYSNVVDFDVVDARQIVNWEAFNAGSGAWNGGGSWNLANESKTFSGSSYGVGANQVVLYASEEDVPVKITFAAGAGGVYQGGTGGDGGKSIFTLTLQQNYEYTVKLSNSSGGNGSGANFLYKGGTLLVAIGGGGGSGHSFNGGKGGGIGIAGQNGFGSHGGQGGQTYATGQLPLQGYFQGGNWLPPRSGHGGGRVSGCTFGQYWINQGYSACQNMGYGKFTANYGNQGIIIQDTTDTIIRGYKAGLGHRGNNGNPRGGGGAVGGSGARSNESGGGGGSGYSNGEVEVLSTQLGGNNSSYGYITIEKV